MLVLAGGHIDSLKGKDSFTESSNFTFITGGGAEVEGCVEGGSSPGPVQEVRSGSRPASVSSEKHELEESSGEGGFSFLNATIPEDEATPPVETPPPQKSAKTPSTTTRPPWNTPAPKPALPPDVVQQPRTGPALVGGGGAKKSPRKKKIKATRPGVAESTAL